MIYSLISLIFCILTWFNVWKHADIVRVGNRELAVSTLAASTGILTSLVGWSGILFNNRSFLAVFNVLLWATFAMLLAPGYLTYKQRTFNLEGKVSRQWSETLDLRGRLVIQNQLRCCGYYSTFVEATVSNLGPSRLQGQVPRLRADGPHALVHYRLLACARAFDGDIFGTPVFEPCHVSLREGDDAEVVSAQHAHDGRRHRRIREVRISFEYFILFN